MKSFYVEFQRSAWLRALMMFGIGLWIVIAPATVFGLIVDIIAAVLLVMGIVNIVSGFRLRRTTGSNFGVGSGIALIIAAVLAEALAGMIVSMLPLFLGLIFLVYGVSTMTGASRSRQYVNESATPRLLVYGLLVVVAGLFLLFHPFGTAMLIFRIFGGFLLVMGAMEFWNWITYKHN